MASITSAGIGSGLDIGGLVSQLVAAEGQPAEQRIARGEASAQARLSAYGSLKSALSQFRDQLDLMQDIGKFLSRKAASSNEDLFSVSASTSALPGSYAVEVVNLATAQRLTSGAFADADTAVGEGTLTIDVGGEAFDVEITADNSSLAGIRDAINAAGDNSGVTATIVNADSGSYLVLNSEETGSAQTITVTQAGGDGGLAALEYDPANGLNALTETVAAADALVRVDGLDITSANNTISGAIDGLTLELVAASPGSVEKLSVDNDSAAVRNVIEDFVDSYNDLVATFDQLSAYDAETEIAGPLLGDASLRNIRDQLRREMSEGVDSVGAAFGSLRDAGLEIELDGTMSIVDEELDAALADDFTGIGQLFAADGAYAQRLFERVEAFLDDEGLLEARTDGLNRTIEDYAEQRERLAERLSSLETRLLRQFNALDSLVAQLTSTSNFLTQQLANLPTVGGNNNA